MIVHLTANKISSFGIRDEEEERQFRDGGRVQNGGRQREAPVISCVNVTMSPFCCDTGADGQSAFSLRSHSLSSEALSRSPQTAVALLQAHVQYQAKMRCCLFVIMTKYGNFCLTGRWNDEPRSWVHSQCWGKCYLNVCESKRRVALAISGLSWFFLGFFAQILTLSSLLILLFFKSSPL